MDLQKLLGSDRAANDGPCARIADGAGLRASGGGRPGKRDRGRVQPGGRGEDCQKGSLREMRLDPVFRGFLLPEMRPGGKQQGGIQKGRGRANNERNHEYSNG